MEELLDLIQSGSYQAALQSIQEKKEKTGKHEILSILEAAVFQELNDYDAMYDAIAEGLSMNYKNYELLLMLGDYYRVRNEVQAWLCYENAEFYCEDEQDCRIIQERRKELEERITPPGKVSIILLSYHSLDMIKNCIASIRENCSKDSYELIVVDNASEDGSVEWLREQTDIKLLCNGENAGFPKGCNQGIRLAESDHDILLLNNDTLMMPHSLFWLRMGLYEDVKVGSCGSVSNNAANHQKIKESFPTVGGYLEYAIKNNIPLKYPYEERGYLVGFALLIKREALDFVGLLDEQFTPGNFEDADYGARLLCAGYYNRLCKNSFIFHWGGKAFGKDLTKYQNLLDRNKRIFEEKWKRSYTEYNTIRTDMIEKMQQTIVGEEFKVLDLACGFGMTLAKLKSEYPKALMFGIASDREQAQTAERYGITVCDSINSMLLEGRKEFDHILGGEVLERQREPERFLREIRELLKEDGSMLLSVSDVMRYPEEVLKNMLCHAGYTITGIWYYGQPSFWGEEAMKENALTVTSILYRVSRGEAGE